MAMVKIWWKIKTTILGFLNDFQSTMFQKIIKMCGNRFYRNSDEISIRWVIQMGMFQYHSHGARLSISETIQR